jgi:hypothetical protein
MITLNTQLILLATWCLFEVDPRNSKKSHKSLNNVVEKMKKQCAWDSWKNKIEKDNVLERWNTIKQNETLKA